MTIDDDQPQFHLIDDDESATEADDITEKIPTEATTAAAADVDSVVPSGTTAQPSTTR